MALIIDGIISALTAGTALYSAYQQSKILEEGQDESRRMFYADLARQKQSDKSREKLAKEQLITSRKQFKDTMAFNREQLGVQKSEYAHGALRNVAQKLTGIMGKNEQLKNLYINRLSGLRT